MERQLEEHYMARVFKVNKEKSHIRNKMVSGLETETIIFIVLLKDILKGQS